MRSGSCNRPEELPGDSVPPQRQTLSTPDPTPRHEDPEVAPDARWRIAQECAPEGIWEWDVDTGAVRWSDETYRLFEVERGSYMPSLDGNAAFVHPDDRRRYHQALAATLRTCQPLDIDIRIIPSSGLVKYCNCRAMVVCDSAGNPVRLYGTCHDISARRRAEMQLAYERVCLETSLAGVSEGVILVDPFGDILLLNPAAERMTGWVDDVARSRPLGEVLRLVDETTGLSLPLPMPDAPEGRSERSSRAEALLAARGGARVPVSVHILPISDGDRPAGMTVVLRELAAPRAMAEATARLEQLQVLGILAGGIAHDFNNVLGGLFGCVELARREIAHDTPEARLLDEALSIYPRARELTGQLMRLADKGAATSLRKGRIDRMLHEVAGFSLSGSNVACEIRISDDLWPCEFDKSQLGQAIGNILVNARQAMPEGGSILVEAGNALRDRDGDPGLPARKQVHLSITDSGEGIPPEVLERIFDPFFSTRKEGQGLGLAAAHSVIRRHGGSIAVESSAGRGSTFRIALPASEPDPATETPAPDESHRGSGTILVLDDDPSVRMTLARMLVAMGYATIEAPEGLEALELCAQARARGMRLQAAVIDLTIPGGLGGKEILSDLRRIAPDLAVFAVSGYPEDPVLAEPGRFGFTGSIAKPFRIADLMALLARHLPKPPASGVAR